MDSGIARGNVFEPIGRAFADTWLQVRAKPVVYILIWLTLVLLPYVVFGLAFSSPIWTAVGEMSSVEPPPLDQVALDSGLQKEFLSKLAAPMARFLGWYGLFTILNALMAIFTASVLSGTVRKFRDRTFPKYAEALTDGARRFWGFLKAVLYSAWIILWRPVAVNLIGGILGYTLKQPFLSTAGFFIGFFMFFTRLYRYGLGPFIHLSRDVPGRESVRISLNYYMSRRPIVSMLFMSAVVAPFLLFMVLFTAVFSSFGGAGGIAGIGLFLVWVLWSVLQFVIIMTLLNFSMNEIAEETPVRNGNDIIKS